MFNIPFVFLSVLNFYFSDSILSAEAPEFVPRMNIIASTQAGGTGFHRSQPTLQINHNLFRNHSQGSPQNYSVKNVLSMLYIFKFFIFFKINTINKYL